MTDGRDPATDPLLSPSSPVPTTRAASPRGPVAGIDIGGTKIAILVVDADGAVLGRATRSSSVSDQAGAAAAW